MNHYKLKILVIENNPLLNDGRRAAELVGMADKVHLSVDELIDDIKFSSHGLVSCEVAKWETVDEFAHHRCQFRLGSGDSMRTSDALDSDTVEKLFAKGWYGWWDDEWFRNEVCPEDVGFSYDYARMIEEHNIIERRKNGEFDMIMLVNIDPVYSYEACMIGRGAYWINGEPIECDCPMTAVMNVSVSRRDANFECFGHMMEMIMSHVFCGSAEESGYTAGEYNGMDQSKLNLWTRFVLCSRNYDGISGCGNVHFSPNSTADYDWRNEDFVMSSWRDWCDNYPNLTGQAELTNCRAYLPLGIGERDACRLHHRWWFYCMPHVSGVTPDGYSNSWWDYFAELDYVVDITTEFDKIEVKSGDGVEVSFTLKYRSGKTAVVKPFDKGVSTEVSGNLEVCTECCAIKAVGRGRGVITVSRDGVRAAVDIKIC